MNNLSIVEALGQIAREKNVDRELVIQTLADALVSAAKRRYGNTENYEVEIDPIQGKMEVFARMTVVEEVVEPSMELLLEDAQDIDSKAELGSVLKHKLDFSDFGRNAIQTAKQILIQRVREAERERIHDEFIGRVGTIESGTVQQISHGDIVLNLGRAEAAVPYKEQIRRERYRQGDAVRGLIYEVLKSSRGPQVLLSRTHPEFLKKLFSIEVPEISEGIVEIHAVAREPGERAKIAVSSTDERVDPVGACVGIKGSRVQAIVRELSGERIDIVPWIDEPDIFITRALSPATVTRCITDSRRRHAVVIVEEDQLSLAIGKGGQNSRLAVQLTGWGLDIITEDQYQERRAEQEKYKQVFRMIPGISELIALSLTTSGFDSITSITEADLELLQTVPGLENTETASTIRQSATHFFAEHGEIDVNTLTEDLVDNAGPDSESAATHTEADSDMATVEVGVEEVLSEAIAEPVGADVEPTTGQDVSVDIDENAETGSDIAGSAVENAEEVISADPEHLNSENSEEEPEQGV
jgi:N utilization substance protein A